MLQGLLCFAVFNTSRIVPSIVMSWAFVSLRVTVTAVGCSPAGIRVARGIRGLDLCDRLVALFDRSWLFLRMHRSFSVFEPCLGGPRFYRRCRPLLLLVCRIFVFRAVFGCVVALFRFLRRRISLLGAHKLDRFQP